MAERAGDYAARAMRVLWVNPYAPRPDGSGGDIRAFHLLRALSKVAATDLVTVGSLPDLELRHGLHHVVEVPEPRPRRVPSTWERRVKDLAIAGVGKAPYEVLNSRASCRRLHRALVELGAYDDRYDVVHIDHECIAPLARGRRNGRWILQLHNVASERSRQQAAVAGGRRQSWMWERDAARARRLERWARSTYDQMITVCEEDVRLLGGGVIVPNGVDLADFTMSPLPAEPTVLFSATFGYPPNIDAAIWLCRDIFPRVRASVPDATLTLVGRKPVDEVIALGELPGVAVHADVPTVLPYLRAARVAVVPLRIGTGTRIKALEAMAVGRPLVGTAIGLEGLGLVNGLSAAIADDPAEFAEAMVALLTSDDHAKARAAAARRLVEEHDWGRITDRFVDVMLGDGGPSRSQSSGVLDRTEPTTTATTSTTSATKTSGSTNG